MAKAIRHAFTEIEDEKKRKPVFGRSVSKIQLVIIF